MTQVWHTLPLWDLEKLRAPQLTKEQLYAKNSWERRKKQLIAAAHEYGVVVQVCDGVRRSINPAEFTRLLRHGFGGTRAIANSVFRQWTIFDYHAKFKKDRGPLHLTWKQMAKLRDIDRKAEKYLNERKTNDDHVAPAEHAD